MTYTINSSSPSYQAQTLANVNSSAQIDNAGNNVIASAPVANGNSDSFVQNILQSLQNLGVNTADSNTNQALQVFVQDLSQALAQGAAPPPPFGVPPTFSVDNIPVAENSTPPPTTFSGGTNFQYNVDLNQADLGENLANVSANIKTALDNIGQFISSKIVFDLKIMTISTSATTLAQANAAMVVTTTANSSGAANSTKSTDASFVADSISGVDSSPNAPDSTLYINLANMDQMSFSGLPTPGKYDLTSILTHEILHGLAFTGNLERSAASKTAYDTLIETQNDPALFFVGRHAKTTNAGNPVPLAPASAGQGSAYYHVANPSDLMSTAINKGEVKSISALDVAMLEDMGISVTGVVAPPSKVQIAYSNPLANLQNLMNSLNSDNGQHSVLQADFTALVESFGGSASTTNLQDFLTQLSTNTTNGNSLQPDSGSIFSATA
jgi:hypothetical protein